MAERDQLPDEDLDALLSVHASASDILRWVLQSTVNGRIGKDRKDSIKFAARRILTLVEKL